MDTPLIHYEKDGIHFTVKAPDANPINTAPGVVMVLPLFHYEEEGIHFTVRTPVKRNDNVRASDNEERNDNIMAPDEVRMDEPCDEFVSEKKGNIPVVVMDDKDVEHALVKTCYACSDEINDGDAEKPCERCKDDSIHRTCYAIWQKRGGGCPMCRHGQKELNFQRPDLDGDAIANAMEDGESVVYLSESEWEEWEDSDSGDSEWVPGSD